MSPRTTRSTSDDQGWVRQLRAIGSDRTSQRRITSGRMPPSTPRFDPALAFSTPRWISLGVHLWRGDANGDDARQLTSGEGEQMRLRPTAGGPLSAHRPSGREVGRSSDGGEPDQPWTELPALRALFSRQLQNTSIASYTRLTGRTRTHRKSIPVKGGGRVVTPPLPRGRLTWNGPPTERASRIFMLQRPKTSSAAGAPGKDRGDHPIHGQSRRQYRWSPDGKRLLLRRRMTTRPTSGL